MTLREHINFENEKKKLRAGDYATVSLTDGTVVSFSTIEDLLSSEASFMDSEFIETQKDKITGGTVLVIEDDIEL